MDMGVIESLISNVGFPIVMSLILIKSQIDISKSHKEETEGFIKAIGSLESMLGQIKEKLETINEKVEDL